MSDTVRIIIIDDHELVVDGLRFQLEMTGRFAVVGSAATVDGAMSLIKETNPDCVIVDLSLKENDNGLTLIRELREFYEKIIIIAISFRDDPLTVQSVRQVGANGFISKNDSNKKFIDTINAVVSGSICFPGNESGPDLSKLSGREIEVLSYLGHGYSYESIADQIGISHTTTRTYIWRIQKKLGFSSLKALRLYVVTSLSK